MPRLNTKEEAEVSGRVHAAHQALGLLDRLAGEAHGLPVEAARPHVLKDDQRPGMVRHAAVAQRGAG